MPNLKSCLASRESRRAKIVNHKFKEGQALIGVLAVIAVSIVLVSSLMMNSLISADSSLKLRQSSIAISAADSYMQNALIKIIRDPNYTGETLTLDNGRVIIEVTGDNPKNVSIKSINSQNDILRQLSADVGYNASGAISVSNWTEI
jgi:hypothetical protein